MGGDLKARSRGHAPVPSQPNGARGGPNRAKGARSNGHAPALLRTAPGALPAPDLEAPGGGVAEDPSSWTVGWPAIRALELMGMRWNLLILSEVAAGVHRFGQLERELGIPRKTLSRRLSLLVAQDLLERREREGTPPRVEYVMTGKGRDLYPALAALMRWGERNLSAADLVPA